MPAPKEPPTLSPYQAYEIQRNMGKDQYERDKDIEDRGLKRAKETRDIYAFDDKKTDQELNYRGAYGAPKPQILDEIRQAPNVPQYREEVLPVPKGAGFSMKRPDGRVEFTPQPKGSRRAQVFDGMGYTEPVQNFIDMTRMAAQKKAGFTTPQSEEKYSIQQDRQNFQEDKYVQGKLWKYYKDLSGKINQHQKAINSGYISPYSDADIRIINQKLKSLEKRMGIDFQDTPPLPHPKQDVDIDAIEEDLRGKGASEEEIQQARQEMGY